MIEYENGCASKVQIDKLGGILPVYKEKGMTSHDVVNIIRKLYNTKQVGHTGTLDPMAEGVLVMLLGRAVKASEYVTNHKKCYKATFKLGIRTDTGDITGKILDTFDGIYPQPSEVIEAAKSFLGDSEQLPPMYSAKKVNGKKLYELARSGIEVERKPQKIFVSKIEVAEKDINENEYYLEIDCSSGTYIRTICTDIGEKLGCGATMTSLVRLASGMFKITQCKKLSEIEMLSYAERLKLLHPTEEAFKDLPILRLNEFFSKLAHDGLEIYQKKIRSNFRIDQRIRLYDDEGFFAIGENRNFTDGEAIKPIKQFRI